MSNTYDSMASGLSSGKSLGEAAFVASLVACSVWPEFAAAGPGSQERVPAELDGEGRREGLVRQVALDPGSGHQHRRHAHQRPDAVEADHHRHRPDAAGLFPAARIRLDRAGVRRGTQRDHLQHHAGVLAGERPGRVQREAPELSHQRPEHLLPRAGVGDDRRDRHHPPVRADGDRRRPRGRFGGNGGRVLDRDGHPVRPRRSP